MVSGDVMPQCAEMDIVIAELHAANDILEGLVTLIDGYAACPSDAVPREPEAAHG